MITEKIMKILKERNIKQTTFFKDTNIKKATFEQWKKGSIPGADKIITIVNYLEISADELLGTNKNHIPNEIDKVIKDYNKLKKDDQETIKSMIQVFINKMEPEQEQGKSSTSKIG